MATYQVWYMRPEWFAKVSSRGENPDPANLDATHIHLRNVEARNLDQVFRDMQGDVWSPNGAARDLIRDKGLVHTSLSVGDVIVDPDGAAHLVAMFGFKNLGRAS
jgi:hypothetical protein